ALAFGVEAAVCQRGVEEGDALVECFAQGTPPLGVINAAQHFAADAPGAEAHLRNAISGVPEESSLHRGDPVRIVNVAGASPADSAVSVAVPGLLPARTMTSALPLNSRTCLDRKSTRLNSSH